MDKFQATDIINDFSDADVAFLHAAREGVDVNETNGEQLDKFLDRGFVRVVNFEHVRANNSLKGVLTTADGDKLLQELDQRAVATTSSVDIIENGETHSTKTVEVLDPNPTSNNPELKNVEKTASQAAPKSAKSK